MDPSAFDTLAKAHAQRGTRRSLLRLLTALPLAGALAARMDGPEESVAHPVERIQKRRDHHRKRARRRQDRRHDQQTRDNGAGGNTGKGNRLGSFELCGTGQPCPMGTVCLSGVCFTTCPGPFSCLAGSGGCSQFAACQQTTSGASVCTTLTTNVACTTDAECGQRVGLGAICIVNPPDTSCQGNLPAYCAVNA